MTTIAYRDGIMASDSGCWAGDASHGWARKLAKGPWVRGGCRGAQPQADREGTDGRDSSFIVLAVSPDGPVRLITARGEETSDAPYYAVGAAAPVAFGAMFVGASAEQAIEAAKEHGSGAFGRVQTISHETA